jgi:hypothetical protein
MRAVILFLQASIAYSALCGDAAAIISMKPGSVCQANFNEVQKVVRPTQTAVGYVWVQRTMDKDMTSKSKAQAYMDSKGEIPIVLGPGGVNIYILNGHHTLASLDGSGYHTTLVTLRMVCDYQSLSVDDFWAQMADSGFAYLYGHKQENALPVAVKPSDLPTSFKFTTEGTDFDDDRWRSMVGFSRKIALGKDKKYVDRCMDRVCRKVTDESIPFFEYRWSYYFEAAYRNASAWGDDWAYKAFNDAYTKLPDAPPGKANVADWQAVADLILPLCRGAYAGEFEVPPSFSHFSGKLPGYHKGMSKISPAKDTDCAPLTCPYNLTATKN